MNALIHFPANRLAPVGGPAGYLYNLNKGLAKAGIKGYEFLPEASLRLASNVSLQRIVPNRIKEIRRLCNLLTLPSRTSRPVVDYSEYEIVHFHSTVDLYLHREALGDYQGKVILTSHSPCAYHIELMNRLNPKDVKKYTEALKAVELIDSYAFERADYVVFPCPEAEEPYFNTWKSYANVRDVCKLRYLLTGIEGCTASSSRDEVRECYGIPEDAFVVCYVGRHNEAKGYFDLVDAAPRILDDSNTWMLVAGKSGTIPAPDHRRWIEVGWTDDPHSLMSAADVFLLPNRETYFDLVLLEALSLGQIVLATRTGGNKYFERFGNDGIRLYENRDELLDELSFIREAGAEKRLAWGDLNRKLFYDFFTCDKFANGYNSLVEAISNE